MIYHAQQKQNMNKNNRKSIRLKNWNYSNPGIYFVTICTQNRECILGNIVNGKMILNNIGRIVQNVWESLSKRFPIESDAFQIMPNHVHGIIVIHGDNARIRRGVIYHAQNKYEIEILKSHRHMGLINQTPTLGQIIRYFKAKCSHQIHKIGFNQRIWQRNFYEHIVRNENDYLKIQKYILDNPKMWQRDKNNPIFL